MSRRAVRRPGQRSPRHVPPSPEATGVAGTVSPWNSPICLTVRALGPLIDRAAVARVDSIVAEATSYAEVIGPSAIAGFQNITTYATAVPRQH